MSKKKAGRFRWEALITRVVDGDTADASIDLGFQITIFKRIRLWGIDAPESRTRDLAEKELGLASKARLIELIEGKRVTVESHELGKYGRVLGVLFLEDLNVNQALIDEGHAVEYDGGRR